MASEVRFEPGLYRGAAGYYERFRLPYPDAMIADLARRAAPSGCGRLLDLACGTGQLAFPLRGWFAQVWAVDAEPGMTEVVRAKATAAGAARIRTVTASAEDLRAEPGRFELIVIGNAGKRSATRVSQLGTEVAGRTVYAPRNGAVGRRRNETCPDSSTR